MINGTVSGRLGRDAETRQAGASQVTEFSIASDDKSGKEKTTTWIRASIWGDRGTKLAQYLTKGKYVTVSGPISQREYQKDGQTKTSLEMKVGELEFGPDGGKKEDQGFGQGTAPRNRGDAYEDPEF